MARSVYHAPNTVDGVYLIPMLENHTDDHHILDDDVDDYFVWDDTVDDIANTMRFPENKWGYYSPREPWLTREHKIIAVIDKHELYVTLSEYGGVYALSIVYYGERPLSKKRAAYVKAQVNRFKKGLTTYYKSGTFSNGESVFYQHTR